MIFLKAPVARAIMSPLGILLGGAGTAVGIVAGLPVAGAAALGVAAWAGRVATTLPRASRRDGRRVRIDPFTLNDPWRRFVQKALQARGRFDQAVGTARSGPLRDRLEEIGDRVDSAVQECWGIANRGQELADARRQIDAGEAEAKLAELEASTGTGADLGKATESTMTALRAQLATASRLEATITETRSRLQLLDARLNEAAARSVELSVQAGDGAALAGLGADVDSLVGDMEALRQGLEELGGTTAPRE